MGPAPSTEGACRGLDRVLSPLGRTDVCSSWPCTPPGAATASPGPPTPSAHSGPSAALWPLRAPVGGTDAPRHSHMEWSVSARSQTWRRALAASDPPPPPPPATCICSFLRSLMHLLPAPCSHGLLPPVRAFCPCLPRLEASRAAPSEHPTLGVSAKYLGTFLVQNPGNQYRAPLAVTCWVGRSSLWAVPRPWPLHPTAMLLDSWAS